jgi:hypothetical protein
MHLQNCALHFVTYDFTAVLTVNRWQQTGFYISECFESSRSIAVNSFDRFPKYCKVDIIEYMEYVF